MDIAQNVLTKIYPRVSTPYVACGVGLEECKVHSIYLSKVKICRSGNLVPVIPLPTSIVCRHNSFVLATLANYGRKELKLEDLS